MTKYFTVPAKAEDTATWAGYWYREMSTIQHPTAYEKDRSPRDTGLLDQYGSKIMASDDGQKIGFLP